MHIKTAAVLGAGTMGAQIAAHLANAGVPALLLDITPEAAREGFERARALKPDPFFTPEALAEIFSQAPGLMNRIDPYAYHLTYLERQAGRDSGDPYSYLDLKTYLPEDLLMLGDKMTMATSLELRVPFCDHRLVEFMARVAPGLRAPGFKLKALLKEIMAPSLPGGILDRPKRGFTLPLASWFKGPLRGLVLDLLSEERLKRRGYLNPLPVQQLLTEHLSGTRSYFDQIFSLLVFELWHQAYLDEWAGRQAAILREVA